jgi:hypothetical protein
MISIPGNPYFTFITITMTEISDINMGSVNLTKFFNCFPILLFQLVNLFGTIAHNSCSEYRQS